ncbi:MAG: J domain-containing protein [Alphaproteobacteria bacterium]|nr:J domain-containing protein [Alphaproteobacteria bacterium]
MAKMTVNEAAQILGIPLNATRAQLKKAYRALCMKYHPDKNPGDKHAEEMFKKVAEANEVFLKHLERGGNSNQGNGQNRGGQSSNTGTRPGADGGARPGNNNGGGAGRTGSTGTGANVNIDSILKTFWQKYQQAKRDHENFINGELATTRQKVKDTEAKLVQADNLDKKLGYVQTLQRLLMQEKMQVARAVMLAKMANMYLKQYEDATARFNRKNQQGGR